MVVAVKDNPAGLDATLRSLQAVQSLQDRSGLEVLVIDGGSQPPTLEVIERFAELISYRESGQDRGIADAFNRGIERATGTYVAILNSGDCWLADTLEQVRRSAMQHDCPDVLHGDVRFVDARGAGYVVHSDLRRHHQRAYLFHPCLFVRRDCYERLGGYDTSYRLAMDSEWTHRAIRRGARFMAVDAVLANMELGGLSDTGHVVALGEFRRSVVSHGLARPATAWFHYWRVRLGKRLGGVRRLLRGQGDPGGPAGAHGHAGGSVDGR